MADKTLIDLVQDLLSPMSGDQVNSIYDTEESEQVARIVINVYNAFVSNSEWLHTRKGLTLVPASDNDKPTHIRLNDDVKKLEFINYDIRKGVNVKKDYTRLLWKEPDDFLRKTNTRDSTAANVKTVVDYSGIDLLIYTDKNPEYYTSFDDENIIFDSYNSDVDTTIQESKIQAVGFVVPKLSMSDDSVINLPPDALSAFYQECLSTCQWQVRQFQDPKAEQESIRGRRWMSRSNWRVKGGIRYPNYGRNKQSFSRTTSVNERPRNR